jgi:hypothetical protein
MCGYDKSDVFVNCISKFNNKDMMLVAKGTWTDMEDQLIHKTAKCLEECLREQSKGELPMSINFTHIPEFYYHYVLNF